MFRQRYVRFTFLLVIGFLALGLMAGTGTAGAQEGTVETQTTGQTVYEIIEAEPALSDFAALIDAAALADNLQEDGPFTVFAPTDAAWAEFNASADRETAMTDVLLYHVMNGEYFAADLVEEEAVTTLAGDYLFFAASESEDADAVGVVINETVPVARADIEGSNGVVHIIDTVLSVPEENSVLASDEGSPDESIVTVLAEDGRFETLVALLEQAGLTDELENADGRYTLFAPTDEAFDTADPALVEEWLADPEGALQTILSYHIVNDRLTINQIANDDYLPTLEGRAIAVTIDEFVRVYLNGRQVRSFNILADNGIIHVVDEVVLP
jgi:uncharacterized surface protein with fasciclin (FAS1) repeats